MSCDPYEAERRGRDAARYHEDWTMEHNDIMRKAEYSGDPFSCERHYADAYEREMRYQEELRAEARREEEEQERRAYEAHQQRLAEEDEYEYYCNNYSQEEQAAEPTEPTPTPEGDNLPF